MQDIGSVASTIRKKASDLGIIDSVDEASYISEIKRLELKDKARVSYKDVNNLGSK